LNTFNNFFDNFITNIDYIKKDIPETKSSKIEKLKHCNTLILNIIESFLKMYKFGIEELIKILSCEYLDDINKITTISENIKHLTDIEFYKITSLFNVST
jgi:hypothetical protein